MMLRQQKNDDDDDDDDDDDEYYFDSDTIENASFDISAKQIVLSFDPALQEISETDLDSIADDIKVYVGDALVSLSSTNAIGHEDIPYSAWSRLTINLDETSC